MILRRLTYLLTVLSAVVALCGCSGNEPLPDPGRPDPDVYLQLSVATTEAQGPASRADQQYPAGQYPDGYDYGFEGADGTNELIHTMRFIVVRPNGHVEHNILVNNATTPATTATTDRYRVHGDEIKTIWLIGNEASLPTDYQQRLTSLTYGDTFPTDADLSYTLSRADADTPLLTDADPIPMTEFHDIYVDNTPRYNDAGDPIPQTFNLFVTRAAVKFTFNLEIKLDGNVTLPADVTPVVQPVSINEIADMEYLFPRDTEYRPAKTPVSTENRIITQYTTPSQASTAPFTLQWHQTTDRLHYSTGTVYLPETAFGTGNTPYSINFKVDDVELSAALPDLPSLPRNTHVKVNLTVHGPRVYCEVDLVPYIGVVLNPDFGLNRPEY